MMGEAVNYCDAAKRKLLQGKAYANRFLYDGKAYRQKRVIRITNYLEE
jgi:hypothetical protein